MPGYFQPVEIKAPAGALISPACDGRFDRPSRSALKLGLVVAAVYRLRVTQIPEQPGLEVYPTIEIIDRTYPPVGQELQFPIPIELAQEELEMALAGQFVTRVVYVEDPERALPAAQQPGEQFVFEAAAGEDPLAVADRLGRPVAIVRLGGRVPDAGGIDQRFLYGSPGYIRYTKAVSPQRTQPASATARPAATENDSVRTAVAHEPVAAATGRSARRSSPVRHAAVSEPAASPTAGPQPAEIVPAERVPFKRGYPTLMPPTAACEQP